MEGIIRGLAEAALGLVGGDREEGPEGRSSPDREERSRSTWAEVVASGKDEDQGLEHGSGYGYHSGFAGGRKGREEEAEEENRFRYNSNSLCSRKEEGDLAQGRKDGDWEVVGHHNKKRHPWKQHVVPKENWQSFKLPPSEQQYTSEELCSTDTDPSNKELSDLSEACDKLWQLDLNRLVPGKDYEIECGEGKKVYQKGDVAPRNLFKWVGEDVFRRPTYARFSSLLDNYNPQQGHKEVVTTEEKHEQDAFILEISRTSPIKYLHKYLLYKGFVSGSYEEFKATLTYLWFDPYSRGGGSSSSSAFEHVFVGEIKVIGEQEVSGFHNWIQFYLEEAKGNVDYQGYIFPRRYNDHPDSETQLLTIQFEWNGVLKSVSSTLVGVSPEFELALYTLCFFVGEEDNHSHPIMEKVPISRLQKDMECESLIDELQIIWNEVGESEAEKDEMLLQLEQECLEIYRRKVDQANRCRAQLRQAIADSEAEIATICSAMGERPLHLWQNDRSLKEEFKVIVKQLEEMRERKSERLTHFLEIVKLIQYISAEISPEHGPYKFVVDESDLSLRRLEDLQKQLDLLQKEKSHRLQKVLEYLNILNSLCLVLGIDFKQTATEVQPSLIEPDESKSVCNSTIEKLRSTMQRMREIKLQRMHKLQDLASTILEMWHLMDTPVEEQQKLQNVTRNIAASEHEITEPNAVSMDFVSYVEAEVLRLEELKASKMKDLILKKKIEVDELRRRTHLIEETDDNTESAIEAIKNGSLDLSLILEQFEVQLSMIKEEAFSRKEILERVEKWLDACEDESWLEEYNRDENRYNIGKGTHLILKRAEKARAVVAKIPGIVETLTAKVMAWENERGTEFIYDGTSLLSMLEEYTMLRQEKEQERKRLRDQRRLQGQLITEQESMFGSKPSPSKPQHIKKLTRSSTGNRKLSVGGGASLQPQKPDPLPAVKCSSSAKKPDALSGDAQEGVTPRKPFTPLGQSYSVPSTPPHRGPLDAVEEENKTPMAAPISDPKNSPGSVSTPMQMTTATHLQQEATMKFAPQEEVSFEERRLAFLLKG